MQVIVTLKEESQNVDKVISKKLAFSRRLG